MKRKKKRIDGVMYVNTDVHGGDGDGLSIQNPCPSIGIAGCMLPRRLRQIVDIFWSGKKENK